MLKRPGLRQLLRAKPHAVFSHLIPSLIARPINASGIKALATLSSNLGNGIYKYIINIIDAIVKDSVSVSDINKNTEEERIDTEILKEGNKTLVSGGLMSSIVELLPHHASVSAHNQITLMILCAFVKSYSSSDAFSQHIPQLIQCCMYCLVDLNSKVTMASWHQIQDILLIIEDDEIGTPIDWMINCINPAMSTVDVTADRNEKQVLGFVYQKNLYQYYICLIMIYVMDHLMNVQVRQT